MSGYTKLFSDIITSSVWSEDNNTRIIWITLLALSDPEGYVRASLPGLSNAARIEMDPCIKAIEHLKAPDPYSRTKDNEGRRIIDVAGGWQILNYEFHRDRLSDDKKTVQSRARMKRMRQRNRGVTLRDSASASASEGDRGAGEGDKAKKRPVRLFPNELEKIREAKRQKRAQLRAKYGLDFDEGREKHPKRWQEVRQLEKEIGELTDRIANYGQGKS